MSAELDRSLAFLNSVAHLEGQAEAFGLSEHGTEGWGFNNASFDDYCGSFGQRTAEIGEPREGLREIVERQLGKDPANIGLDVAGGSQGTAIRSLIAEGILGTGLVTNLFDTRTEETKANRDLHHIDGDIVSRETWMKIIEWRKKHAPEGFALIMHRPIGALQGYPEPFYAGATYLLLDMLRPGGVFFTQVPHSLRPNTAHEDNIGLQTFCEAFQAHPEVDDIAINSPCIGGNMYASPNMVVMIKR